MSTTKLPDTVGRTELATVLGVSPRHVSRLAENRKLPRRSDGSFPLAEAVRAFMALQEAEAKRRIGSAAENGLRTARRHALEARLAREERTLVMTDEAAKTLETVAAVVDEAVAALPEQLAVGDPLRAALIGPIDEARRRIVAGRDRATSMLRTGSE